MVRFDICGSPIDVTMESFAGEHVVPLPVALSLSERSCGLLMSCKARNSTCPLARDKWIFRRTTNIADIVVRRTTWIAAGSVTRQILVPDFNGIPLLRSRQA